MASREQGGALPEGTPSRLGVFWTVPSPLTYPPTQPHRHSAGRGLATLQSAGCPHGPRFGTCLSQEPDLQMCTHSLSGGTRPSLPSKAKGSAPSPGLAVWPRGSKGAPVSFCVHWFGRPSDASSIYSPQKPATAGEARLHEKGIPCLRVSQPAAFVGGMGLPTPTLPPVHTAAPTRTATPAHTSPHLSPHLLSCSGLHSRCTDACSWQLTSAPVPWSSTTAQAPGSWELTSNQTSLPSETE